MATKDKLQDLLAKAGNTLTLQVFAEKVLKPIGVGDSKCKKGVIKGDILTNFIDVMAAIYAAGGEGVNNSEDDAIKALAKMKVLGSSYKSGGKLGSTLKAEIAKEITATPLTPKGIKAAQGIDTVVGAEFVFNETESTADDDDLGDEEESVDFAGDDYDVLSGKLLSIKKYTQKVLSNVKANLPDYRKAEGDEKADAIDTALSKEDDFNTKIDALIEWVDATQSPGKESKILSAITELGKFLGSISVELVTALKAAGGKGDDADKQGVFSDLKDVMRDVKEAITRKTT